MQDTKRSFEKRDTLAVKGVAILLMLFYHLFESQELLALLQVDHRPFPRELFLMLSGFGNICVAVFAFLSAFGITRGLETDEKAGIYSFSQSLRKAGGRCLKLIDGFAVMYISVNVLWHSSFDYVKLYGGGWQGGVYAIMDMLGLAQILNTPTLNMTWWYMELAILIIFLVPMLYPLVKKAGRYLIVPALLLPTVVQMGEDARRYYMVVLFGMLAAHEGWLEKLLSRRQGRGIKLTLSLALLVLAVTVRQNFMIHTYFLWIVDAPIALFLCWFVAEFLSGVPGLSHGLVFLGRHSMNMFFVHTFFYMILFQKFIYSFRYAGLIFLVLVGVSLAYSTALELVKSGVRYVWRKIYQRTGRGKN